MLTCRQPTRVRQKLTRLKFVRRGLRIGFYGCSKRADRCSWVQDIRNVSRKNIRRHICSYSGMSLNNYVKRSYFCGLFCDFISNCLMHGKMGKIRRKWSLSNRRSVSEFAWRDRGKPRGLSHDSRCPGPDLNRAFPEYKSKALPLNHRVLEVTLEKL